MTTIAYRDGVMAADSRAWSGSHRDIGAKWKIRRLEDGTLLGASSSVPGGGEAAIEWYILGHPVVDHHLPETFDLLVVKRDGAALFASDKPYLSGPLVADYFAIGTGANMALGAMFMRATAIEAVRAACHHDTCSALPIRALTHDA